ncbi:hypothetical protein [Cellulomonas septica]|uniref:Uncharacterized protein n=1 Tax=Cellulomonas septica TaxID=285080 RepID=A0ABX1JV22_9CELL|nr:hypothetical protein [Cellulomonas septica]NKY38140.1 hypothetical protein [Cellulomonas septica]
MSTPQQGFQLTRAHLVTVIAIAAAGAIVSFIWAALAKGSAAVVASALASTFLSVAVATLVTEIILKPAFTHDVLEVAGVRARIHQIGFRDTLVETGLQWSDYYAGSSTIGFVVARPGQWVRTQLDPILDAARRRSVAVDIYLAEPGSASARGMAASLGVDSQAYDAELNQAVTDVSARWRRARENLHLHNHASIGIHYLTSQPLHTVAVFDGNLVLMVPPLVAERTSPELAFVFGDRAVTDVSRWLEDRWRAMTEAAADIPVFEEGRSR